MGIDFKSYSVNSKVVSEVPGTHIYTSMIYSVPEGEELVDYFHLVTSNGIKNINLRSVFSEVDGEIIENSRQSNIFGG